MSALARPNHRFLTSYISHATASHPIISLLFAVRGTLKYESLAGTKFDVPDVSSLAPIPANELGVQS